VLGGAVNPELGGLYYQPTLLTGAAPGSEILTEEVFGPVLTLQSFAGESEAVALANDDRGAGRGGGDRARPGLQRV
jgi:5-carboxymethyl-2-hydroxymuconic-semialdehyde dehydrogenase